MKLNLYEQSGSDNHGCEAIIRSTIEMFQGCFDSFELFSQLPESEYKYGLDQVCNIHLQGKNIKPKSLRHVYGKIIYTLIPSYSPFYNAVHCNYLKSSGISLQTGGDNYCYGTQYRMLGYMNDVTRRRKMKSVLWGVSIEPEIIKIPTVRDNLKRYDLITARESITFDCLQENGVVDNVILCPDPAFTLKKIVSDDNPYKGAVGINLSPLVLKGEERSKLISNNYRKLVRYIVEYTDKIILLVPHVVVNRNDDRIPLKLLYDEFADTGRVAILDDMNCEKLKGYISECDFFIGARTHSTIAAYSSCVPTLVLGYSIKSKGIARDLFGSEENYVVSVSDLKTDNDLLDKFLPLFENRNQIREHLKKIMPTYIESAYEGKKRVLELAK